MRVFISHGTDKDDAEELAYLDEFEAALRALDPDGGPQLEVLLDRTGLSAGDQWADVLHAWLARCDAAVLLLSTRALARPWVFKEVTILKFRADGDAQFLLLPVLLPGVNASMLDQHPVLSALALPSVQAVRPGMPAAHVAAGLRASLRARHAPANTPMDRLERALEAHIHMADAVAIEAACQQLPADALRWHPGIERRRQCARALARAVVVGPRVPPVQTLSNLAETLRNAALDNERIRRVIDLAASIWVPAVVADGLRAVMQTPAVQRPLAAINSASREYGAMMVVWRTQLPDILENIYWVVGGCDDGQHTELVTRIAEAFYQGNKDDQDDAADAAASLQVMQRPVFFVLPPPLPDARLGQSLHTAFPSAIFLVHTDIPLTSAFPAHIVPLRPALEGDPERDSRRDYNAAHKLARGQPRKASQ